MRSQQQILHVFGQADGPTRQFNRLLEELGIDREGVPDCYSALARVVSQGPHAYEAVLVRLEGLTPEQHEFFRLMRRRFKDLPVYVYGGDHADITPEVAIRAGAQVVTDCKELRDLLSRPATAARRESPQAPRGRTRLTDLLVDQIAQPADQDEARQTADARAQDHLSHRTAHMPSGPLAPREKERPKDPAHSGTTLEDRAGAALLSEEEIKALLGDDGVSGERPEPINPNE